MSDSDTSTAPTDIPAEVLAASVRAVFRIFAVLRLADGQAMALLGQSDVSTFEKWRHGDLGVLANETILRVSALLAIYQMLQQLFDEPTRAAAWIKRPNEAFGGLSALEKMLGGTFSDVLAVRDHLDANVHA